MKTATKPTANFFEAKPSTEKKESKKSNKVTVDVPKLKESIQSYYDAKEKIDLLKTQLAEAEAVILESGKQNFLSLYKKNKCNPNSFYLSADGNKIMYIPKDQYKIIDLERYNYLNKKYGKIANSDTTFSFNSELLEKYKLVISELIAKCSKIDDQDKPNLIEQNTEYSINKGTIDILLNINKNYSIDEMFNDIAPVVSLKKS